MDCGKMRANDETFPQLHTHKLTIPLDVWRKMRALVDEVDTEVMWYLLRSVKNYMTDGDPLRVDDIFVPKQAVSGGAVNMNFDDFESLNEYCRTNGMFSIGDGHSHVNFGVSPSGTDLNDNITLQLTTPGMAWYENGFIVTLIMNKKGAMSARLDMRAKPEGVVELNTIASWEIGVLIEYPDADEEALKKWVEAQKEQLRPVHTQYTERFFDTFDRNLYGRAWDDTITQTFRPTDKKGLSPVWYGMDEFPERPRTQVVKEYWAYISQLIARGWTVALDTRLGGFINGEQRSRVAIIVTRKMGNKGESPSLVVPFASADDIAQFYENEEVLMPEIIESLANGDGLYYNPNDNCICTYEGADPTVGKDLALEEVVWAELESTMIYKVHSGRMVTLSTEDEVDDYIEKVEKLYDTIVGD